jgi:hypothetical protein
MGCDHPIDALKTHTLKILNDITVNITAVDERRETFASLDQDGVPLSDIDKGNFQI